MTSKFESLDRFIRKEMRMSHIYQPVMLMELLKSQGKASIQQIAQALLARDASQLEYYEQITKNMVGRVLTRNRGLTSKDGNVYSLNEFAELSDEQVRALTALCEEKIKSYIERRGDAIWDHRRRSSGHIPGTARYEVLKRAKYRCELCGVSAETKALEVDHIVPRNYGGSDELHNLQALCYSCNATKRDRDDTDFRGISDSYAEREKGCPFCELPEGRIVAENELAVAFRDGFPVSKHHTLIIPKRHAADYFSLHQPERNAIQSLLEDQRVSLLSLDPRITGFNIGSNCGEDAGQTVFHCHLHLIPRRAGDVEDPRGGVRGVIPENQHY